MERAQLVHFSPRGLDNRGKMRAAFGFSWGSFFF
jgi:hypothetical protein